MTKRKSWHSLAEYQALRALMQGGTATAAAQQLGLSQSAISRSIANLEGRIGQTLFERESGRLMPTQEAVRLNRRLDPLFDALDRIDGPSEPVQETLRLIAPPTYAQRFLIGHIATFLRANPNFFVSLEVTTSDEVIRGILDDRFDLGVTGVELSRAGVKLLPYRSSQAVVALPLDHPLIVQSSVSLTDLENQPLVSLTHRHARRAEMDKMFTEARITPRIIAEVSTSFAAAELVREGMGVAILNPFPVYHTVANDILFRPIETPLRYRSYFAVSDRRPTPRIVRAFIRHLRLHTPQDPFSTKA